MRLFRECFRALADNVERVLTGKREVVELALTALFAEGHLLVEDVPGTGKTTLARAISASLDATCRRVQFTPDLLPSDITGVSMFRQTTNAFEFLPGPVFANIVIGDEINRASPKTQSALLEVMEEGRVTVDGVAHPVPRPFMVVATQNPVDMSGTYPLPEAQLDRFLMRITVGYPDTRSRSGWRPGRSAHRSSRPSPRSPRRTTSASSSRSHATACRPRNRSSTTRSASRRPPAPPRTSASAPDRAAASR
ncbi:AAA family ATPase [Yinghuangia aomiensis]